MKAQSVIYWYIDMQMPIPSWSVPGRKCAPVSWYVCAQHCIAVHFTLEHFTKCLFPVCSLISGSPEWMTGQLSQTSHKTGQMKTIFCFKISHHTLDTWVGYMMWLVYFSYENNILPSQVAFFQKINFFLLNLKK